MLEPAVTLWRCARCGHSERGEDAPLHCGQKMKALAVEMARPERRHGRCCLGKRKPGL